MLVKSYVDKGMLVPDPVMTRLMLPRLEQLSSHSWLLDGKRRRVLFYYGPSGWFLAHMPPTPKINQTDRQTFLDICPIKFNMPHSLDLEAALR